MSGPSHHRTAPSYAGPWSKLTPPLTPWLVSFLSDLQFHQMTPVQASTIPLFLSHKDVVVEAVTGSGKTLAFVLPVLEMLLRRTTRLKKDQVGALIVSPTRELAEQIYSVTKMFLDAQDSGADEVEAEDEEEEEEDSDSDSSSADPKRRQNRAKPTPSRKPTRIAGVQLVTGGGTNNSTPSTDYRVFRDTGPDILIGTPGRLETLLSRPGVKKGSLEVLVLDEADRLLDLGFTENLQRILSLLPKQRRTGLFSATMTDALAELVRMGLRNPVRVVVKVESKNGAAGEERRTPASLQNMYAVVKAQDKFSQLLRILSAESAQGKSKFIVYFATCAQVSYFATVASRLPDLKMSLYALHGKQTPSKRKSQFDSFVASTSSVLFCTDVAARGLDLPDVECVVQYDAPTDPKVFSHRCGRTARAGRRGRAIVMLTEGREVDFVAYLEGKRIPLSPYAEALPEPDVAKQLERTIRELAKADREVYEASIRAYVSYVRAYSKHELSYIFRLADLDLAAVAHAFALIRLPAMPELKARRAAGRLQYDEDECDFDAIAYRDRVKESARLAKLEQHRAANKALEADKTDSQGESDDSDSSSGARSKKRKGSAGGAWSAQKERKESRLAKKDKRARKRAFLKTQDAQQSRSTPTKAQDSPDEEEDDWDEDYRQLTKEKRDKRKAAKTGRRDDDLGFASDSDGEGGEEQEPFFVI